MFNDIFSNRNFFFNFLAYFFGMICYSFVANGSSIELEGIGGSIYINLAIFSFLELLTTLILIFLIKNDNSKKNSQIFTSLSVLSFALFIFGPKYLNSSTGNFKIFLRTSALFGKSFIELVFNINFILISKILPVYLVGFTTQFSMIFSRMIVISLPYVNYYFRKYFNLHPFVLYSIFWFIQLILLNFTSYLEENKNMHSENLQLLSLKYDSGNSTPLLLKSRKSSLEMDIMDKFEIQF